MPNCSLEQSTWILGITLSWYIRFCSGLRFVPLLEKTLSVSASMLLLGFVGSTGHLFSDCCSEYFFKPHVSDLPWLPQGSRAVPLCSVLHGEALGKKLIPPEEVNSSGGEKFGSRMQPEPCLVIAFNVPVLLGLSSYVLRCLHVYPREIKMHIILQ